MSNIEEEIRLKVNREQIKKIKDKTKLMSKKTRMVDITCGKYGFDSLSKVGYICRVRSKNGKNTLEIKNYLDKEKSLEKSLDINSLEDGIEFLRLLDMKPYLILDRKREIRQYDDLIVFIDEFNHDIGNYIEIEYQNSNKEQALQFINSLGLEMELQEKYGDIVKKRLEEDKEFKNNFSKLLANYKYNIEK